MKKNVLGVLKNDMDELVYRLNTHHEEYLRVFSSERTRKNFDDVFFSRYRSISGSDLTLIKEEELRLISKFYHLTYDLHLYLMLTEDMPSAVANKHSADLKEINDAYKDFVEHYINSSGAKVEPITSEELEFEKDDFEREQKSQEASHTSSESGVIDLDTLHLDSVGDSIENNSEAPGSTNLERSNDSIEETTDNNKKEIVFDGLTSLDELDDEEEHKLNDDDKRESDAPPPFKK